ncbi:hypothetical protein [Microseira wollei]|uniref:Uncharacterized protein n=1 Tax=Microseira wollei NIES-4236 TaxID=2530354 RepID=A0AAV3XCC7_9CYAN|nr:hypothetical protein [Microseira wollei]GET38445.1 hypothetical protein MiSe_32030 [Microseira wollei NIES-4236]
MNLKYHVSRDEKRKLIRKYFECLRQRSTTTESFAKQVIADLISHWKEKRAPKEAIWAYFLILALLISLVIHPFLTFLLIIAAVLISKSRVSPNITPPVSDEEIDQWLLEDKRKLFKKAPDELDVKLVSEDENTPELLNVVMNQDNPIELSSGFELENEDKENDNKFIVILRRLIGEDYFVEKGLDGKTRHSIHIFMVIFLCRNFLSYYKCHWNFIRGVATLVETGEYLYDTIVSVNTQELSSASLLDGDGKKVIFKKLLQINTTDGKGIEFPAISDIRVSYESSGENDITEVRDAAHIIREMLRERRIDIQITKPFDADD